MENIIKGNGCTVRILGVPEAVKESGKESGQKAEALPVIWLHTLDTREGEAVFAQLHHRCVLACIECADWNGELSPWHAQAVSVNAEPFAGRAAEHLKRLTEEIIPQTEAGLPFPVRCRGLAGYSMAGLFAAYAMYQTDIFQLIGAMSASFWYEGFREYAMSREPAVSGIPLYISLGSREHRVRNAAMASVKDCTEALAEYWKKSFQIHYEVNPGGHFEQTAARTARGIDWLLGMGPV